MLLRYCLGAPHGQTIVNGLFETDLNRFMRRLPAFLLRGFWLVICNQILIIWMERERHKEKGLISKQNDVSPEV